MTDATIIRLCDAQGSTVLDSISTEYEDSFCLESFGDLIKLAQSTEPKGSKHFIIAKVQTWDHKQPDRAFYSYYHAHHLNKLLFQTQIYLDKKLIHRLHVLNPLTNTDIIGNVLYFMVVVGKSKKSGGIEVPVPPSPAAMVQANITLHNNATKQPSIQIENVGWTLSAPVSEQVDQQEYNQLSSPQPGAKLIIDDTKSAIKKRKETTESKIDLVDRTVNSDGKRVKLSINTGGLKEMLGPRSAGLYRILTPLSAKMPMSAYPISKEKRTSRVPLGTISQHGERLTVKDINDIVPHGSRSRRRSLSYMNAIQASGSFSASIRDWKESLHSQLKLEREGAFDDVQPIPASARIDEDKEEVFYQAVLVGTDNDFLESYLTRQLFRENAVQPQDSALFEMPPYTGPPEVTIGARLADFCCPTDESLARQPVILQAFHRVKFLLFLAITFAVSLIILWFIMPPYSETSE